jgi:hypothetical protein
MRGVVDADAKSCRDRAGWQQLDFGERIVRRQFCSALKASSDPFASNAFRVANQQPLAGVDDAGIVTGRRLPSDLP